MGANTVMLVIAVPAAIAGAACMGLASAAQARAAHEVPDSGTLNPRLLVALAHRKLWLIGVGATLAGLGLQVVALGYGPLLLVQPLLVTALPFASTFAALMAHRKPDRVLVLGGLLCVAGLSTFLLLARPTGGSDHLLPASQLVPLAIALAAVVVGALAWAAAVRGPAHVLGLAAATGVTYGVTAALIKVVAGQLRTSLTDPFSHWTLYAVCIVGPIGFLLSQNTFQQGKLVSPALAVITTIDPLVGVAIGVWWLDESATTGTAVLSGEIIAAVAIVAGIAVVARRAAHRVTNEAKADEALAAAAAMVAPAPPLADPVDRPAEPAPEQAREPEREPQDHHDSQERREAEGRQDGRRRETRRPSARREEARHSEAQHNANG